MKTDKIRLAMVIAIYLAIACLIIVIIVLVKNVEEIKTDPISYGVDKIGFDICTCLKDGKVYNFNGVNLREEYKEGDIEWDNLK